MLTLKEIRKDLKDIKYYYSRQKLFEEVSERVGSNTVIVTVNKYNEAIKLATPKLFDLYVSLYVKNHTQESFADELGFTPEYIQMLNKKLLKFFQSNLAKEVNNNDN